MRKKCGRCGLVKSSTEFHINRARGNLQSYCKPCRNLDNRLRRAEYRRVHGRKVRLWRPPYGEKAPNAKLCDADIPLIRGLQGALPVRTIAEKFEVSPQTIYGILNGSTWTHA